MTTTEGATTMTTTHSSHPSGPVYALSVETLIDYNRHCSPWPIQWIDHAGTRRWGPPQ